jgi:hypothetical protein
MEEFDYKSILTRYILWTKEITGENCIPTNKDYITKSPFSSEECKELWRLYSERVNEGFEK